MRRANNQHDNHQNERQMHRFSEGRWLFMNRVEIHHPRVSYDAFNFEIRRCEGRGVDTHQVDRALKMLTQEDLSPFLEELKNRPKLRKQIYLEGIREEHGGLTPTLQEHLPACTNLQEMTFYSCYLGETGTKALLSLLSNNQNLKTLALWNCDFGRDGASATACATGNDNKIQLMEALAQNKSSLTKLVITQDQLKGEAMAKSVENAIAHNTSLEYIQLGSCDRAVLDAIAMGVEHNVIYKQIHVHGDSYRHDALNSCQKKIDIYLALNKAGRKYLVQGRSPQESLLNNLSMEEFWLEMVLKCHQVAYPADPFSMLYCLLKFSAATMVNVYFSTTLHIRGRLDTRPH